MPHSAIGNKARTLLIGAVLYVAVVIVTTLLHARIFYPHVLVDAQGAVNLEFLQPGLKSARACEEAASGVADTIRIACPTCRVATRECLRTLTPEQAKLLSSEAVDVPVSRLPRGVVAYVANDKNLALAACRESERLSSSDRGSLATCYPPGASRARPGTLPQTPVFGMWQGLVGLLLLALTGVTAALVGFLILRYEALHARWTHDHADAGPQKFHATPTPRIGGLGVMAGLLVSVAAVSAAQPDGSSELFGYLVLASLPAFLGGIVEDITKNVDVPVRLVLTMLAAALGAWLLGAIIPRLDVPGLDTLLRWTPFAIAFTMFAVGGVANAINIIDGYNGLAAGHAVIVLAAMACVSAFVGDSFLFMSALAMTGALVGFLVWNYPKGKIFLGDGGAYLLGFWLGELSVLLVERHPEVSPWFPLLLLVFPIFETIFSMYRRKIVLGLSPGQPDRYHMHQVLYAALPRTATGVTGAEQLTRQNSRVAPYFWLMSVCCAVPAILLWRETGWLVSVSLVFCAGYVLVYRKLSRLSA
jgi:UDP-N-acetylmuramyl pentapeptide phosphotransferase/UDP-N-acetylglucosamine-1-phosphate transferase